MNIKTDKEIENKIEYHNQVFELLTLDNDFKKDISLFREKWHISVSACEKYCKSVPIEDNQSVDFSGYENTILGSYVDYRLSNDKKKGITKDTKVIEYQEGLNALIKKYHLSFRYLYPLKTFIYLNKIIPIPLAYIKNSFDRQLDDFNDDVLEITVYPDSTDTDINYITKNISKWLDSKRKGYKKVKAKKTHITDKVRFRKIDNYKLKKRIWELYNLGENYIFSVITKEFIAVKITNEVRRSSRKGGVDKGIYRYIIKDPKKRDARDKEYLKKSLEEQNISDDDLPNTAIVKYINDIRKTLGRRNFQKNYFK